MFTVYVLKSEVAKKSYVGVTDNIDRRLHEHNSGKHFYTKRHKPWLVIFTQIFDNFQEARKREKYLKTAAGRKFLKTLFQDQQ